MSTKFFDRRMTIFATVTAPLALFWFGEFSFAKQPTYQINSEKSTYSNDNMISKAPGVAQRPTSTGANSSSSSFSSSISPNVEMPRWEFRTAPIALWARWYTLDVSYRISEKWATGPSAVFYGGSEIGNMFAPNYKGYAVGWNANYYFKSVMKDGWYLSTHSYYEKYSSYPHAYLGHEEIDGFRTSAVAGYQWRWSAVNLMTGLGGEYGSHNVADKPDSSGGNQSEASSFNETKLLPYIEFKIGIQI